MFSYLVFLAELYTFKIQAFHSKEKAKRGARLRILSKPACVLGYLYIYIL